MDNADQKDFWNNTAGPKWLVHQAALDETFQPVLDGVLTRAELKPGQMVLDVGCGTGASTVQAARIVGQQGHVLGVDISAPLLARARERGRDHGNVSFAEADAARHPFDAGCFHHLISRFGVMFFSDPAASFANMARALVPGGKVTFAAWGQIANNPFFTLAAQAAKSVVGAPPKVDPDQPGPFAFRDPDRVTELLGQAGLKSAACEVVPVQLTPAGGLEDLADMLSVIGPAHSAATHLGATAEQRAEIKLALAAAFAAFQTEKGLRIPAEINFFSATA